MVPASNGVFPVNFLFTSTGSTVDNTYSWALINNTGTVTIRGKEYIAFAFYSQQWPQVLRWINVVGVEKDGNNIAIVYLDFKYWDNIVVTPYWEEDLFNTLQSDDIDRKGVPALFVDRSNNFAKIPISFPAINTLIPTTLKQTNIEINGTDIYFDNTNGWQIYNNINYTIYAFSFVNCDNCPPNCPECLSGPWYEIHHSAVSPDQQSACFGIYYIYPKYHNFVQWNYTFCFPDLVSPNITYQAEWKELKVIGLNQTALNISNKRYSQKEERI